MGNKEKKNSPPRQPALEQVVQRGCMSPSMEAFKTGLNKALSNLVWPCFEQKVGLESS